MKKKTKIRNKKELLSAKQKLQKNITRQENNLTDYLKIVKVIARVVKKKKNKNGENNENGNENGLENLLTNFFSDLLSKITSKVVKDKKTKATLQKGIAVVSLILALIVGRKIKKYTNKRKKQKLES